MSGVDGEEPAPASTGVRARSVLRGAASLLIVPALLGGIYLSAKAGMAIADRQVPPESVVRPGEIPLGTRWSLRPGTTLPVVARELNALREFEFLRSTEEFPSVEGVESWTVASEGARLELVAGGDRRHLHVLVLGGERNGDRLWIAAADLRAAIGR